MTLFVRGLIERVPRRQLESQVIQSNRLLPEDGLLMVYPGLAVWSCEVRYVFECISFSDRSIISMASDFGRLFCTRREIVGRN